MAGLENLFSVEPTLPSIQTHKVPDNPERWAEVLTTFLREQYPDTAKLPITVEFRKRDDQTGTCIGALHVTDEGATKSLFVPFVIKKFSLCPLDIWMDPKSQDVHPLTKDTFKEVFFVESPADGLDQRPTDSTGTYFNDPSMWNTNYPPLQGRYSYASAGYPILDQLSDTFTKTDGDLFKDYLRQNPHLVVKLARAGHGELIEKLARKTYVNENNYTDAALNLIPTTAVSVKKEDYDTYSILSCVEGLFDTAQVVRMNTDACAKFLSKIVGRPQDILNELDQEGEKMLVIRKPAPGVFLYDASEEGPEEASSFSLYRVKTKSGLQVDGVVVPKVVDFSGKKKSYKLFISKTHCSMQPSIAGIELKGIDRKDPMKKILEPRDIRVGQTGCFLYIEHGEALATEPVTVKAIEEFGPITVMDLTGKVFKVRRGYGDYFTKEEKEAREPKAQMMPGMGKQPKRVYLDAHGMLETRKDHFVIPEKMMWIPMEGFADVSATPKDWLMKEAGRKMEHNPLTIRWTGVVYEASGADLPKLAMDERQTKLLLANTGCSVEKIAAIMKRAKKMGKASIHGAEKLKPKAGKVSAVAATIAKIASIAKSLKVNLIKEAAEIADEDTATVDALLSLNFLNPDNMAKFVAYKPIFDKVLDYLAELVLASRLGLKDINEGSAVSAMHKLQEVVEGLHRLQVSMKRPATKTAGAVKGKAAKKYLRLGKGKLIAAIS
jgi:hypothetical protein